MASLGAVRAGTGPLVIVLHGFTQTSTSVAPLTELLTGSSTVVAVDLPGHGASGGISADLDETAELVVAAADGEPFDLVGYSLGGRVALHVACRAPEGLGRTVTISASPGIRDDEARARRYERDVALADGLLADQDLEGFLARWLSNPLFATLPRQRADLEGRSRNTPEGLADSLRRCSVGAQRWLVPELEELSGPLLMLAGALDDPFVQAACDLAATSSSISVAVVPGSGHVCHLERPEVTARLIGGFLGR